jgi:hypothetical protein
MSEPAPTPSVAPPARRGRPRDPVSPVLAIVRHDVSQSRFALLALTTWSLAVVSALVAASLVPPMISRRLGATGFVPGNPELILRSFCVLGLLPLAWLLARRSVLDESQRSAWEALSRLPISPAVVLLAKAGHGLFLLAFVGVTGTLIVISGSAFSEGFDEARTMATLGMVLGFAGISYAVLFLAATWGRHRFLALGALAGAAVVSGSGPRVPGLELLTSLIDTRLLSRFPTTAALIAALVVGAVLLATARGQALLRAGQGRLRVSDLVRAAWLALACMGLAAARRPPPPVVELAAPVLRPSLNVDLQVAGYRGAEVAAAQALAAAVGADLAWLDEAVGVDSGPVAIEVARDCEAHVYRRATLRGLRGLLVLAPFHLPEFDAQRFRVWLLRQVLSKATGDRWERGPGRLVREGLPEWRVQSDPTLIEQRAAWAVSRLPDFDPQAFELAADLGPAVSGSLAAWLLTALEQRGPAAFADWLLRPSPELLVTHMPSLRADLSALPGGHASLLERLPRLTRWEGRRTPSGQLRLTIEGADVAPVATWAVVHGVGDALVRDERYDGAPTITTARSYAASTRVRYALVLPAPELQCELWLGWREP